MTTRIKTIGTDCCLQSRITQKYKEGLGDKKKVTPRWNTWKLQTQIEQLRDNIDSFLEVLQSHKEQLNDYEKIESFLNWFADSTISFNAYLESIDDEKLNFPTTRHRFPESMMSHMSLEIDRIKPLVGDGQDFSRFKYSPSRQMSQIRTQCRYVEMLFGEWIERSLNRLKDINTEDDYSNYEESIFWMKACMNRLSSYLYWYARYLQKQLNENERFWDEIMPEFPVELSE